MDIDYVDVIYHHMSVCGIQLQVLGERVCVVRLVGCGKHSHSHALSEESCDGRQKCGAQSLRDRQHCE